MLVVVLVELTLLLFKSNDGFAMIPLSSIFAVVPSPVEALGEVFEVVFSEYSSNFYWCEMPFFVRFQGLFYQSRDLTALHIHVPME